MKTLKPFVPDYRIILQSHRISESKEPWSDRKLYKRDIGVKSQWKRIFDWFTTQIKVERLEDEDLNILKNIHTSSCDMWVLLHNMVRTPLSYKNKDLSTRYSDEERRKFVREYNREVKEFPYRLRKLISSKLVEVSCCDFRTYYAIRLRVSDLGVSILMEWVEFLEENGKFREVTGYCEPQVFASSERVQDYYKTRGIFWEFVRGVGWRQKK